jgi:hypothetical protein
MPKVKVPGRGPGGNKAKNVMNHTTALWTILGDGSFWTVTMDEQGGHRIILHGGVSGPATSSTTYQCPILNKKVSVLMFDILGYVNGTSHTTQARVLPESAEQVISWTTDAVTHCHAVINELCQLYNENPAVSKFKGTCHCNESHLFVICFLVVSCTCLRCGCDACVNINADALALILTQMPLR